MAQSITLRHVILNLYVVILCKNNGNSKYYFITNELSPALDNAVLKQSLVPCRIGAIPYVAMCIIAKLTSILRLSSSNEEENALALA